MQVLIFLLVLAVLIFVHELGHFLLARWNGIRVDAFAIGFGPKIISWTKGETTYSLRAIPFGGYVKIFGENPDAESMTGPDASRSFVNKNRWRQTSVLAAGVIFNFIFAWLLYIIIFSTGVTADPIGFERYQKNFKDERVMITLVSPGSPAEKAGLKVGDVIKSVGTTTINASSDEGVKTVQDAINSSQGSPLNMSIVTGEVERKIDVIPVSGIVENRYAVGITMARVVDLQVPFFQSIWEGFRYTGIMIRETAIGLYGFFSGIFRGTANFAEVAGPVGIAGIVGSAADMGFTYLLMITALISINLGVINLIPFPALDGGRILFVGVEGIIRRRISVTFFNVLNTIGFVLLMALMVFVTYKDIAKLL